MRRLYPVCRSITGDGVRETLDVLAETVPLERRGVPSGTQVHDWTINDEWNVREAYIADATGRRLVDFRDHTLHLVCYSGPVRGHVDARASCGPTCTRCPTTRTGFPTGPATTMRNWGFCLTRAPAATPWARDRSTWSSTRRSSPAS